MRSSIHRGAVAVRPVGPCVRLAQWSLALAMAGLTASHAAAPVPPDAPAPTARCDDNRVEIRQSLQPRDLYVDWVYLDLLLEPPIGPLTPRGERGLGRNRVQSAIDYLLEKGLLALETKLPKTSPWELEKGKVARISLMPAESAACLSEKGESRIKALRRAGLPPGQCVALEWLQAPSASTRVVVTPSTAYDSDRFRLLRLEVRAGPVDAQGHVQPSIEIVDHIGQTAGVDRGGLRTFGEAISICPDRNAALGALDAAIVGQGNPLIRKPELVSVAMPEAAMTTLTQGLPPMPQERFARLRWLETARERKQTSGFYMIDERGEVWTDGRSGADDTWRFYAVQPGRILEAPLPKEGRPTTYTTLALARAPADGYAVVVQVRGKPDTWRLFEFDHELVLQASFTLDNDQVRTAKVEAARDPR